MNVLAFDTSTAATAVCVLREDDAAFEDIPATARLFAPPAHARELLPAAARLLESSGVGFARLGAVAVGVGPGTFTGLRIGITSARAIAEARSLPVRPVSSLAALAAGAGAPLTLAAIDARRGELFAALYEQDTPRWPAWAVAPEQLAERLQRAGLRPRAVGDGSVRFREVLEAAGAEVPPDDWPGHVVRALHVARLGRRVASVAPEALLPDYLRAPDAQPQP